jgi:hypothetical protein
VTTRCSGCEQQRLLTCACAENGRRVRVLERYSGSSTVTVPNVMCQQSFFTRPSVSLAAQRRPFATCDASLCPAVQRFLPNASNLFNHPSFRFVGTHEIPIGILGNVRQRMHAPL